MFHQQPTLAITFWTSPLPQASPIFSLLSRSRQFLHLTTSELFLHSFRHMKNIDFDSFCDDISRSVLITDPPSSLSELVTCYNTTLTAILDKHAPVKSKLVTSSKSNPWFTTELRVLKCDRRRCERQWRSCPSSETLASVRKSTNLYNRALLAAKKLYYSELVQQPSK